MERKKYLEMCQRVATFPDGILGIKQNIPDELKVIYNGSVYYPYERIVGFDKNGQSKIRARLHDLKANCVVECPIEKVEDYKK